MTQAMMPPRETSTFIDESCSRHKSRRRKSIETILSFAMEKNFLRESILHKGAIRVKLKHNTVINTELTNGNKVLVREGTWSKSDKERK